MAVIISLFAGVGGQFFDDSGVPLAGGLVYTYAAGTTTPLATYTTSSGSTPHANPIVLDAGGRVNEVWLNNASTYKFVVKTSAGVTVATYDNVYGATDFSSAVTVPGTLTVDGAATFNSTATFSGNVGIGTTTLSNKFQIVGVASAANILSTIENTSTTAGSKSGYRMTASGTNNYSLLTQAVGGVAQLTNYGAGALKLANDQSQAISFSIAGTDYLYVAASGNVGVGTTTPAYTVEVAGASKNIAVTGTGSPYIKAASSDVAATPYLEVANGTRDWSIRAEGSSGAFTIRDLTAGSERARIDTSGVFQFNSGYGSVAAVYGCRAWVNFNGTGTVAIRASANVSSITDNGTGSYTVNFTNAMPDANYAFGGSVKVTGTPSLAPDLANSSSDQTTSSCAIETLREISGTIGRGDAEIVEFIVFR